MSSQSGSEYDNKGKAAKKSRKAKVEVPVEKKSRRSNRKNSRNQQPEGVLPEVVPRSEAEHPIICHSYQQQITKQIIQIPLKLLRNSELGFLTCCRVVDTFLDFRVTSRQAEEVILEARLRKDCQQPNGSLDGPHEQNPHSCREKPALREHSHQSEPEEEEHEEIVLLVWGKACWAGHKEIFNKTIKQTAKPVNTLGFNELARVRLSGVESDVFVVVSLRQKLECVGEHNGLINQGNTCYMNSYLQMLSHIAQFKNLVFEAALVDETKFPATLQLLFHKLDHQQKPVSAEQLVKSFGWSRKEASIQQDAQEFSCLFYDALERKLQQACPQPKHMSMSEMFEGKMLNII